VRNDMGLTNLKIMVPFCRRVAEGKQVIEVIAGHRLSRGDNGLEILRIIRSQSPASPAKAWRSRSARPEMGMAQLH
jgi:pyruvate,water dikinase